MKINESVNCNLDKPRDYLDFSVVCFNGLMVKRKLAKLKLSHVLIFG